MGWGHSQGITSKVTVGKIGSGFTQFWQHKDRDTVWSMISYLGESTLSISINLEKANFEWKLKLVFIPAVFFFRQIPSASTVGCISLVPIRCFGSNTPETGYFPLFKLSKALITHNTQASQSSLYGGIPQWLYFHYKDLRQTTALYRCITSLQHAENCSVYWSLSIFFYLADTSSPKQL